MFDKICRDNANHPVVAHALWCLSQIVYPENAKKVRDSVIRYFNK